MVYGGWNSVTCTWNKQFPNGTYKRGDLKNFSRFTDNISIHPEVFGQNILQSSQKIVFAGVSFLIKLQAGNLRLSKAVTGNVL